jgi:hypothetical protein
VWSTLPEPVSPELQAKRAKVAAMVAENVPKTQARMQAEEGNRVGLQMQQNEADNRLKEACRLAAPTLARHPSTVSFPWFTDTIVTRTRTAPHKATVTLTMAARNSYGLELRHRVVCTMDHGNVMNIAAFETS